LNKNFFNGKKPEPAKEIFLLKEHIYVFVFSVRRRSRLFRRNRDQSDRSRKLATTRMLMVGGFLTGFVIYFLRGRGLNGTRDKAASH